MTRHATDPIEAFRDALDRARRNELGDPTAAALATADRSGRPSARMVLLKAVDARGFVFYTNLESRKAREIDDNPRAALCFHWVNAGEQVRIEGRVERITDDEADGYFASRARGSQIAAWASRQSAVLASREELERCVEET